MAKSATSCLISIIIPVYNMGGYIAQAVESVVNGVYRNVEVLIVDDGSTDGTREMCSSLKSKGAVTGRPMVRYLRKENGGKASALNFARPYLRGDYVAILDADDRLAENSLADRIRPITQHRTTPDVTIGGFRVFREDEYLGSRPAPPSSDPSVLRRRFFVSFKTPFHLNNCLISRSFWDKVGPFDTRLRRCQDIDFAIRMLDGNPEIAVVHEPVYEYRKHRVAATHRLRIRWDTAQYRALTLWKNASPGLRVPAVGWGLLLDALKAGYELTGTYNR